MKRINRNIITIFIILLHFNIIASQTIKLNMKKVIEEYSMCSLEAKNAALNYKNDILSDQNTGKAFFPTISYTLSPFSFNRSIRTLQRPDDGSYSYIEDYSNSSNTGLSISQKVPYLNGSFSVSSSLNLLSELSDGRYSFSATPYRFSYQQKLLGEYKIYRWDQQINKLKSSKIAKKYARELSSIQEKASRLYMEVYVCRRALEYAQYQCFASDSLLKIARIRYEQGNMLEKESLTLEIQNNNQHLTLKEEERKYSNALNDLLLFLNMKEEDLDFEVDAPEEKMPFHIQVSDAVMKVQAFSPDIEDRLISEIEAEQKVYTARVAQWFNANLSLNYGTNQYGSTLADAYRKPLIQQSVSIGLQIPLFNWGIGRNNVIIAKNEYLRTKNTQKQEREEKDANFKKNVEEYNYLVETMEMSEKSYNLSQKNFELVSFEFEHQRATVDEVVEAETSMKDSFIRYLNNLTGVWKQYFSIRSECLYDYLENKPLTDLFQKQIINWK